MHFAIAQAYSHESSDEETIKRFDGIVRRTALALAARTGVDHEELWSVGALGLLEAVSRFDPARGVRIETFVAQRIRGAMLDELRRMDRLPRRLRGRVSRVDKERHRLSQQLGREPTRGEIADAIGVGVAEVDALTDAGAAPKPLEAAAALPSSDVVDALVVSAQERSRLMAALEELPGRLKLVLSLRYVDEYTLKEVGAVLGVSEPRICQLHNAAIKKLRAIIDA